MSEADTCRKYVLPKLYEAGWKSIAVDPEFGGAGAPHSIQVIVEEMLSGANTAFSMYAGLSPYDALAIYAVITYMDCVSGVWFPTGGMHAVPRALARALCESGADLRYGVAVGSILRDSSGRVAGVSAGGEQLSADAVVVTLDLPTAYDELLPDLRPPRVLDRAAWSPSALVWHVGVRGEPKPGVAHHNIHFADAWSESFEQLIKRAALNVHEIWYEDLVSDYEGQGRLILKYLGINEQVPTIPAHPIEKQSGELNERLRHEVHAYLGLPPVA